MQEYADDEHTNREHTVCQILEHKVHNVLDDVQNKYTK